MHRFPSGVIVLQLREMGVETTIESTADFVSSMGSCSAKEFADNLGVTVVLAKERFFAFPYEKCKQSFSCSSMCLSKMLNFFKFYRSLSLSR